MTAPRKVFIANRGEIAVRIARAVSDIGWRSVAAAPAGDPSAAHLRKADAQAILPGRGAAAYLDIEGVIAAALASGAGLVHPGYGFLSESAAFARACEAAGLIFVGPSPEALEIFGDKVRSRETAAACAAPLTRGSGVLADAAEARAFMEALGRPVMLKALAGGGGRGIRVVRDPADLAAELERCRSEARTAFGDDRVLAEELVERARHVEVQIVGDGTRVMVLGERECSLQRRHQKLIEIAPAAFLPEAMRRTLHDAARRIGTHVGYRGLATVEFLVAAEGEAAWFLEVNPRLQVEHTVTEEVTGLDLVGLQLRLAVGGDLAAEGLSDPTPPRGMALQMRVNAETVSPDGAAVPARGRIARFDFPSGGGLRTEAIGHAGHEVGLDYDSLLAKLVAHVSQADPAGLWRKAYRAACEARVDGVATNLPFLRSLLAHAQVRADRFDIGFVDRHAAELAQAEAGAHPALDFGGEAAPPAETAQATALPKAPEGAETVAVANDCRLVELLVAAGDRVAPGQTLAITEAMKMEFAVAAPIGGVVLATPWSPGDAMSRGAPLLFLQPDGTERSEAAAEAEIDPDHIRDDLQRLLADRRLISDAGRPEAVARRRATGRRTARETLAELCDPGSFREFGAHALAAQRGRRSLEELKRVSPADGVVTGLCTINAARFGAEATHCAVMAYDYTVFAGTQGILGHLKKNRLFRLAEDSRLPLVMFVEGGGGRPGDTDEQAVLRLHNPTFANVARLKSRVPVISVVSGRCFAGNAALAAASDVIVATRDASLGMGGPAMIEGGGLGLVAAEAVGPVDVQARNGVLDMVVEDEVGAVAAVKALLALVQGPTAEWTAPDPRRLRHIVPQAPRRAYRMQDVIAGLADEGSILPLRPDYGLGVLTVFARIEGRPVAILANNPEHLGGAIDAAAACKAAEFAALAEKLRLPLLKLCDTPGFMVGPAAEAEGLVRQAGRMFAECARLSVPQLTVVVRKAYGLGALAMVSGDAHGQGFTICWPTGHFGKMGLEGQVRLGHRRELAAIRDPAARQARERELIDALHDRGSPQNAAAFLSVDEVVDPAETRDWIVSGLQAASGAAGRREA